MVNIFLISTLLWSDYWVSTAIALIVSRQFFEPALYALAYLSGAFFSYKCPNGTTRQIVIASAGFVIIENLGWYLHYYKGHGFLTGIIVMSATGLTFWIGYRRSIRRPENDVSTLYNGGEAKNIPTID